MKEKKLCIFGIGGFGREVFCAHSDASIAQGIEAASNTVFMVDDAYFKDPELMGIPVLRFSEFDAEHYDMIVAIGDPALRKSVINRLPINSTYRTIIHPSAIISQWVEIGEGSIITAGCILTCQIKIGKHAHLNLQTTIGHDCTLGDYFTSAPSASINGNCIIGDMVYFGTSASTRENIKITDNVTIGMGAIVTKDITEPGTYIGCPAKLMDKR